MVPSSTEAASATVATVATAAAAVYYLQNGEMPSKTQSDEPQSIAERMASITDEEITDIFNEKMEQIEIKTKEVVDDGIDYFLHHKAGAILASVLIVVALAVGWMLMIQAGTAHILSDGEKSSPTTPVTTKEGESDEVDVVEEDEEVSLASPQKLFPDTPDTRYTRYVHTDTPDTPREDEKGGSASNDWFVSETSATKFTPDKSPPETSPQGSSKENIPSNGESLSEKHRTDDTELVASDSDACATAMNKPMRTKISVRTPIKNGLLRTPIRKRRLPKAE